MADSTIPEEIASLETRLTSLDTKIDKQENIDESEEGGSGNRFRVKFADIDKLYKERDRVRARLRTLRMGS